MFTNLITVKELVDRLGDPALVVLDARFALADPLQGRHNYLKAHIPGASYVHLQDDLSGTVIPGKTGRHPLPDPETAAARLGALGIDGTMQVVVYDDAGGALAAARAWWMLGWLGHDAAGGAGWGMASMASERDGHEERGGTSRSAAVCGAPAIRDGCGQRFRCANPA